MEQKLLTITIPTFNRRSYLQQTLDIVIPQITDDVEILVCDNSSDDNTWEYLESLGDKVTRIRHSKNIGSDSNFLSCLSNATGKYVWMLCDDDLPCSNTLDNVLRAIHDYDYPPAIFLRAQGTDKNVSTYNNSPVNCEWLSCDRNEFLATVGVWFTFGSSAVVRRDTLDFKFLQQQVGTSFVPASIILSTVGRSNHAVVSTKPLLYARGDNSGGYNGLIVFTRNLSHYLTKSREMGFQKRTLRTVYNNNLSVVITTIVRDWEINIIGLLALMRYSYHYHCFYTRVVPALLRRGIKALSLLTAK